MGRRCLPIVTDVTNASQIEDMVAKTLSEFARVDILVNNAGTIVRKGGSTYPAGKTSRVAGSKRVRYNDE